MDRIAQRRGKWQKLKEDWSPGGIAGKVTESFSPEFQELMEKLREVDEAVRGIADPEDKENALKDLLKVAKANFNRREYMKAITYLGKFHDQLELIDQELAKLQNSVDMKHHEFLFGDLEPEHLEYLTKGMGPKFDKARKTPTGILTRASLDKEAGITDWWHILKGDRRGSLAAYEKRFPRYVKDLKNQTNTMINRSEGLLNFLLASLKVMNGLRNSRKLEEYLKTAKKLQEKFKGYNIAFIQFYNSYVKRFLDYQKSMQTAEAPPEEQTDEPTETMTRPGGPAGSSSSITPDADLPGFSGSPPAPIPSETPADLPEVDKTDPAAVKRRLEFRQWLQNPPKPAPGSPKNPLPFPTPIPSSTDADTDADPSDVVDKYRKLFEGQGALPPAKEPSPLAPKSTAAPFPLVSRRTKPYPISTPPINLSSLPPFTPSPEIATPAVSSFVPDAGLNLNVNRPKITPHGALPADLMAMVSPPDTTPVPAPAVRPLKHRAQDHTAFLTSLAALENEHPMVLSKELIKYAKAIEVDDPEMSQKLLTIAKSALKG